MLYDAMFRAASPRNKLSEDKRLTTQSARQFYPGKNTVICRHFSVENTHNRQPTPLLTPSNKRKLRLW